MNIFNIVHTHVDSGQSDVFLKTNLSEENMKTIISTVCLYAEDVIDDMIMIHEWLLAEIVVKFFDKQAQVLDNVPQEKVKVLDQHVIRENVFSYNNPVMELFNKEIKGNPKYLPITDFILENDNGFDLV